MSARSFLGAGDVYISGIVNGVEQGLKGPYHAEKFSITPKVTTKQSTSKGKTDYGQVLDTVNISDPVQLDIDMSEIVGDVLVLAFLGTASALTQTSGTLAATAFDAHTETWTELGHRNFTSITVTNSGGTVTYVQGTDYIVNLDMGWVKAVQGGAIADGDSVKISGAYGAVAGTSIAGQTHVDTRARIVFDGINQADGSKAQVEVYEAVVSANSAFDFLASDFGKVSLAGTMKTPVGKTTPFTVVTI